MGAMKLIIPGTLPGANKYILACRTHIHVGAKMKAEAESAVKVAALRSLYRQRIQGPVRITFRWVEPDARRDLDNIAFAKKFVLDALVADGYLPGDSRRYVAGFSDEFPAPDKSNPRIEVLIEEVGA